MEDRQAYDTDLTDAEWNRLEPLVPAPKPGGRPPKHTRREIVNGICYAIRSGGAWKLLPHDPPPWRTVYHYFWSGRRQGVCSKSMTPCANGYERRPDGKANPAAQFWTANRCEPVNEEALGAT